MPRFSELSAKYPALFEDLYRYFYIHQIDIKKYNDNAIKSVLLYYDRYLGYLIDLAVAHKALADNEPMTYSWIILERVTKSMVPSIPLIDFYDKFAVNCLYNVLILIVLKIPDLRGPNVKETQIFKEFIPLFNYILFMIEIKETEDHYFKIIMGLLPQFKDLFRYQHFVCSMLDSLMDYCDTYSTEIQICESFKMMYNKSRNTMNEYYKIQRNFFSCNGEGEIHLLSSERMIYGQLHQE